MHTIPHSARILPLVFLALASCIGTDLVGETLEDLGDARIEITPPQLAVEVGGTASYMAVYYLPDGSIDPTPTFAWTSSDPSIASVDANGVVTPIAVGQVMVIASTLGVDSAPVRLTVVDDPSQLVSIVLEPNALMMTPGLKSQLTARLFSLAGDELPERALTYVVSDPTIATVSSDGLVEALLPGTTSLTASVDGITSLPLEIRVFGQELSGTFRARSGTSYSVAGTAILQEGADGRVTLRFGSDFTTSSGPGLHVYLSTSDGVTSTSEDLGSLSSTFGEQQYSVGRSVDLSTYRWVIIHCLPFNVTFGSAPLR